MKKTLWLLIIVVLFFSLSSLSLQAENASPWKWSFLFGYRLVDISGTEFKYKEDINLEQGARLFHFSLAYSPEGDQARIIDRLSLNLQNFGGDPFEVFNLVVARTGRFSFQYERKKATYFYHDLHQAGGTLYDPYTLDFDRRSDNGTLRFFLARNLEITLGYERFTRRGTSTPTLDINRVEFEMEKPVDEDSRLGTLALSFKTKPLSLVLEEKIHDFKTTNYLFLPGYADGGPTAFYPSSLSLFSLHQPYSFRSYSHGLMFNFRPLSSLLLSGSARLINLDMDLDYEEKAQGVDYLGWLFAYTDQGKGEFKRDLKLYDLNASYLLFNRLALVSTFRYHRFDQDGTMIINGEEESLNFGYDLIGLETGLQFLISPRTDLTIGYRYESRELKELETATYESKTQNKGLFGHFRFEPSKAFKLALDYQRADQDEPFTLISPTATSRFKIDTRWRYKNFQLQGSYLIYRLESEIFENLWKSNRDQGTLRLNYGLGKATLSAGVSFFNLRHRADRSVEYRPFWTGPAGSFPWFVRYKGKSTLYDLNLSLMPSRQFRLEFMLGQYLNRGFWPIDRTIAKVSAEYLLPQGFLLKATYKYWNFKEKNSGFNDYRASILEISFGARWDGER